VSVSTTGGAKTSFEADPSAGNHGGAIWAFTAGAGSRRLKLVLRGLRPGSYLATIVLTAQGRHSRTVTLRLRIIGG